MKNFLIILLVLLLAGAAYWYFKMIPEQEAASKPQPALIPPKQEPRPGPESALEPPTTSAPADAELESGALIEEPLPALAESDPSALASLSAVIGEPAVMQYVIGENLIGRIVATIDSINARQLPGQMLPVQPPSTPYEANVDFEPAEEITNNQGDVLQQYLSDPVNTGRYAAYMELLESVDSAALIGLYRRYQPLFEEAYVGLGYPDGGFHARLLEVIDHLLAAPAAPEPVRLIKPEAYYLFADPELENRTAGEKLMVRIGSSNAERVKAKLRELREGLGEAPAT